jgi:hypothetical protein
MGMGMPETRYARSGDVMIAYQVLGEGPFDVVIVPGAVSHVELQWEAAGSAAFRRGLAEHARVIVSTSGVVACPTGSRVRQRWRSEAMTSGR